MTFRFARKSSLSFRQQANIKTKQMTGRYLRTIGEKLESLKFYEILELFSNNGGVNGSSIVGWL